MADIVSIENLLPYSEDFSKWNHPSSVVTMDAVAGPFGGTAAKVAHTAATYPAGVTWFPSGGIAPGCTVSAYVKSAGRRWLMIEWASAGGARYGFFDVQNGVLGTAFGGTTIAMTPAGDGWYRCSVSHPSAFPTYIGIDIATSNGGGSAPAPDGTGHYIWGAQVNQGVTPVDYIPTNGQSGLPRVRPRAGVSASGLEIFAGAGLGRARSIAGGAGLEVFAGAGGVQLKHFTTGAGEEVFSGAGSILSALAAAGAGIEVFAGDGGVLSKVQSAAGDALEIFSGAAEVSARANVLGDGLYLIAGTGAVLLVSVVGGQVFVHNVLPVPPTRVVTVPRATRSVSVGPLGRIL